MHGDGHQTNRQTDKQSDRHVDSTDPAQRAQSVKIPNVNNVFFEKVIMGFLEGEPYPFLCIKCYFYRDPSLTFCFCNMIVFLPILSCLSSKEQYHLPSISAEPLGTFQTL